SGEQRLSNFIVNNFIFTKLVFDRKLWPDFREEDYVRALVEFQGGNRRFGRHDS
ncbi:hypothetical protein SELMODRAFT_136096, partial [Selaginella moellendorffii]